MSNSQSTSEHEIETFLRIQARLNQLNVGMRVKTGGHLCKELERLSYFAVLPMPLSTLDYKISIAGEAAGTLKNPDVDLILQKSTVSSFGRGDKTVMDDAYRRGGEIPGADIQLGDLMRLVGLIEDTVSSAMFIGRQATLKLYKLAVYTEGGHFDWHMDSTHSDQHHATVLLALNTSWVGGDLVLRRNGVETRVDMKPGPSKVPGSSNIELQAVAFYTDIEHKVEPVSQGVRIVLQYDVEVAGFSKGSKEEKIQSGDSDGSESEEEDMDVDGDSVLDHVGGIYFGRRLYEGAASVVGDSAIIKKIMGLIKDILESGAEEVGFAMQYLYRKSSVLPEFLKGSDALLYQALVGSFEVSLHPVVLCESTDYEGSYESLYAHRFDHGVAESEGVENDSLEEDSEDGMEDVQSSAIFYLPKTSAIKMISSQGYIEHTGNEAQPGEYKYFGGGMFVRLRKSL